MNHTPEHKIHLQRLQKEWNESPENRSHLERLNVNPEYRRQAARALARRPSRPEMILYGLILGNPTTSKGFTAQQWDGSGVYDGAWKNQKIVIELDGGGHHAFRDRHSDDAKKDKARRANGFAILREEDESILFLKALAILEAH